MLSRRYGFVCPELSDACLRIVSQAEEKMASAKLDKEYLPITGLASFTQNAAKLAYGADSAPLNQHAVSEL
jgi:aspartate aminotransferase